MPVVPKNPYRQLLARRFPEPVIALLAFLLGVWMWDHYFGHAEGYEPGAERMALVKLDRDLRLAESMAGDPVWLRWLAGAETPAEIREDGREALERLGKAGALSPEGVEAFVLLQSVENGPPPLAVLRGLSTEISVPEDREVLVRRLASGVGHWWDARLLIAYDGEDGNPGAAGALERYESGNPVLRRRAILARGAVWFVGLLGTCCLPFALRRFAGGLQWKPRGYPGRWTAQLGIVVFLAATLAWIGFSMTLDLGLAAVGPVDPGWAILLDTTTRLLPAAIAIGLLFRRGGHVVRAFGLNRMPDWPLVLGAFGGLLWMDALLGRLLGGFGEVDPTGGLSAAEAGTWGLAFAIVSACLAAPVTEEIIYRGVLFRSLANRVGVLAGALVSSAAFALVHFYDFYGLTSVGLFGFICSLVFAATRSLSSAIALHVLYNASVKLPEWWVYHSQL